MFNRWIKSSMQLIFPEIPPIRLSNIQIPHSRINPSYKLPAIHLYTYITFPSPQFPIIPLPSAHFPNTYYPNFKNKRMRKYSQDLQMLNELETDQIDIVKLREQRQLVAKVQSSLQKKDEEIQQLRALLEKYQQYQQKYTSLKVELTERTHLMAKKESECKMLRKQMDELLKEQTENYAKIRQYENERQTLVRERHQMQTAHKEIQMTFKEYQSQFRKRENTLTFDLERAYQQVKQANSKIDQLELIAEEKRSLQEKLKEQKKLRTEERQKTPKPRESSSKQKTQAQTQSLLDEIDRLKEQLITKEEELATNRLLNYQLTLQYDSSINGICTLQTELSGYRKENNELKKILSLMREQQKVKDIEQKYTLRNNHTQFGTPNSDQEEQEEEAEDDLPTHKNYSKEPLTVQT